MPDTPRRLKALILSALVTLAGCGQGEKPAPPAGPATPPAAQSPEPAAPAPEALRRTEPDPEVVGVETTLPADVPLPPEATPVHPPLRASGTTRATFEISRPVAALQEFYKGKLVESGWSVAGEKSLESQGLISAKKAARELSVAMSESGGRTQFVILVIGD